MNKNFFQCIIILILIVVTKASLAIEQHKLKNKPKLNNISIVASSKPIYNLVYSLTDGIVKPKLLVKGNVSPHDFNLKPSDIKLIQKSNVLIWGGKNIEPFINKLVTTRKNNKLIINIMDNDELKLLNARTGKNFEGPCCHKHDHENHNHTHKRNEKKHEHHGHTHNHQHENKSSYIDPHIWLDPENAIIILKNISSELIKKYPNFAEQINKNLKTAITKIIEKQKEIQNQLKNIPKNHNFILYHDAYQYFENRFHIKAIGVIHFNPNAKASAKKILKVEKLIKENNVKCIFNEPQFKPKITNMLSKKFSIKTGTLNPLGEQEDIGPNGYLILLDKLADSFYSCLSENK